MIPSANPQAAFLAHRAEYEAAFLRVMQSGMYILGPEVAAFEREWAAWLGVRHAIGVASGTDALWLALRALNIGPGDEVLTVSLTASATAAAIVQSGARPVFVDVEPATLTLDISQLPNRPSPRLKAVIAVHLYGSPVNMTALTAWAQQHGIAVIEDGAQAHGASHAGRKTGTFGALAAWSFYPTKNLGAFGDGGAVTTNDDALAKHIRLLRQYGWRERYNSALPGWNSRLDELQAAMLQVGLQHLEAGNARRRALAARYRAELPAALAGPCARPADVSAEHLFVVRHPHREAVRAALHQHGIGTTVQYPLGAHQQAAYHSPHPLPVTEQAAREVFSLPLFPELSDDEQSAVIHACHASL